MNKIHNIDPDSNFVWFNFRGIVRFLRKDTLEAFGFLNGIVNNDCAKNETDCEGD